MNAAEEFLCAAPLALTLRWDGQRLTAIDLAWAEDGLVACPTTPHGHALQASLERYVAGLPGDWPDLPLPLAAQPPFRRAVLTLLAKVPRGSTLTYGQLAALAGKPRAARAVGQCMANNPWPLVIPCHRVLGGNGLHGFGPGLAMKEYLLRLEGAL